MKNNIKYELELDKFTNYVTIENKNFSKYEDENGTMFYLNTVQLLTRVDYLELSTEKIGKDGASEYKQALFTKSIDKLDYKSLETTKPVPKNEITGKKEDMYTITDKKIKVMQVWKVSNSYGAFKCFTNKEEAIEYANSLNKEVMNYIDRD